MTKRDEVSEKKQWSVQKTLKKQQKENLLSTKKQKLENQISDCGGLWGLNDIQLKLQFQTEKHKKLAFKVQLNFWQKRSWCQM